MDMNVIFQARGEHSKLTDLPDPIFDVTNNQTMTLCLVEAREPEVILVSLNHNATIVSKTSLRAYLEGADEMLRQAEKWGWERPKELTTLRPINPDARDALTIVRHRIKTELRGS